MKKYFKISILLIAILIITGCSMPTFSLNHYSEKLASIFPSKEKTTATYFGLAEYSHSVTIKDIRKTRPVLTYYITGYINDAAGRDINDRTFKVTYKIDDEKITEIVENNDKYRTDGHDEILNSIIPNQIILKLPLKKGTKWKQEFVYNDKTYTATTTITKVLTSSDKKKQYVTKTIVNKIAGFSDSKYIEERTYEVGRGLISFNNTMPLPTNNDGNISAEDYMFGYSQSSIKYGK